MIAWLQRLASGWFRRSPDLLAEEIRHTRALADDLTYEREHSQACIERIAEHVLEIDSLRAQLADTERMRASTVRELHAIEDRVATIADEAFGPFPEQSTEDSLTAIERGIFAQRAKLEQSRASHPEDEVTS